MDVDGVCSAALIQNALKKIVEKTGTQITISKTIVGTYDEIEEIFGTLEGYTKIIILDIGVDQEIENSWDILFIDHHLIKRDMNSESVVFINPMFENENVYQPASYVVYKFLSGFIDMKSSEWISVLGIVADLGYKDCMDILDNWVEVKNKSELFYTPPGQISNLLLGASYELGFEKTLSILVESESMEELKENEEILEAFKKYDAAFEEGKKDFWGNAEILGNIVFSVIKPKYKRLGSPIINRVSFENPEKMIFIFEERDGHYKISTRYQNGNIDLAMLMKKCCGGGGHKQAAGGMIKIEDLDKFKECILKEVGAEK